MQVKKNFILYKWKWQTYVMYMYVRYRIKLFNVLENLYGNLTERDG